MAKAIVLIASALCVLALAGFAQCMEEVDKLDGMVYCDTCRVLFMTKISQPLHGAEVELTCKNRESGVVTYNVTGKTNEDGIYSLEFTGNHDHEICEVTALSSPDPDCDEDPMEINSVQVTLDDSTVGHAKPIGFQKKEALPDCDRVLDEEAQEEADKESEAQEKADKEAQEEADKESEAQEKAGKEAH